MKHILIGSWKKAVKTKEDFDLAVTIALGLFPLLIQLLSALEQL